MPDLFFRKALKSLVPDDEASEIALSVPSVRQYCRARQARQDQPRGFAQHDARISAILGKKIWRRQENRGEIENTPLSRPEVVRDPTVGSP